jgi:Domain of unknown function (DUF1929)
MFEKKISRRDFLKLIGFATASVFFVNIDLVKRLFGMFLAPFYPAQAMRLLGRASAISKNPWSKGPIMALPVNQAALLENGKVFYVASLASFDSTTAGVTADSEAGILDLNAGFRKILLLPQSGSLSRLDLPYSGLSHLPHGDILLVGGTKSDDKQDPPRLQSVGHKHKNNNSLLSRGSRFTYIVNANSKSITKTCSMEIGRYSPTCLALSNGGVLVLGGIEEYGSRNRLVEVYDITSNTWEKRFDPTTSFTYCVGDDLLEVPYSSSSSSLTVCSSCYGGSRKGVAPTINGNVRMHLLPNGKVVVCGDNRSIRIWDPATGIWSLLAQTQTCRYYGTSILLPLENTASESGKILLVGGSTSANECGMTRVDILDFNNSKSSISPTIRQVASITHRRKMQTAVILPNGKLVIFGGIQRDNIVDSPIYVPEMFDPTAESWQALTPATTSEIGNHLSLLLLDGRVWIAGGSGTNNSKSLEMQTEIFNPDYVFEERPTITGIPRMDAGYGGKIIIPTSQASEIASASLVRLMSISHNQDSNQRLLRLQIVDRSESEVIASAPINPNLAPPGNYMVHILNNSGVPSVASTIIIRGN